MSDVDKLQNAEERLAQLEQEARRDELAQQGAELAEPPIKNTASKPRSPELVPLDQIAEGTNIRTGKLENIHQLALSIKERGLLQAIVVRNADAGAPKPYELVYGYRRFAALQIVHAEETNALVRCDVIDDLTAAEIAELMLVENVQRVQLKPMEVARALRYLLDLNPEMNAASLARSLGLKPDWARRHFRLLELPKQIQEQLGRGDLSFTIADLLRKAQKHEIMSEEQITEVADQVIAGEVSPKEVRDLVLPALQAEAEQKETVSQEAQELAAADKLAELEGTDTSVMGEKELEAHQAKLSRAADALLAAGAETPPWTTDTAVTGAGPIGTNPAAATEVGNWPGYGPEEYLAGTTALRAAFAKALSKSDVDAYLLGRSLRDFATAAYLHEIRVERSDTFRYAFSLEHAACLVALRDLSRHTLAADPNLPPELASRLAGDEPSSS